jgi:hypothetical protein
MWEAGPIDDDSLRQGDLLRDVIVPELRFPFRFVRRAEEEPSHKTPALIDVKRGTFLVVTSCCAIRHSIALAPVRASGQLNDEQRDRYSRTARDEDYPVNQHPLEDHDDFNPPPGQLWIAEFGRIVSLIGAEDLVACRRARMTPEGRQDLRERLLWFWSRAEEEDRTILTASGKLRSFEPGADPAS